MDYSENHSFRGDELAERRQLRSDETAPEMRPLRGDEISERRPLREDYIDDTLLSQIDAFRDKARQLQKLISAKQSKVVSLESMVREKEDELADKQMQIELLQEELAEKQRQADGLVSTVEIQVDRMLRAMRSDFNELGRRIEDTVANQSALTRSDSFYPGSRINSSYRDEQAEPRTVTAEIDYASISRIVEDKVSRGCDAIIKVVEDASERGGRYVPEASAAPVVTAIPVESEDTAQLREDLKAQAALSSEFIEKMDELSPELLEKMDALSEEIAALRQEIRDKSAELIEANDRLADANEEIVEQQGALEEQSSTIEEQSSTIEEQQIEIEEQQNELEELKKTLTELINRNFTELKDLLPAAEEEDDENADTLTSVKEELSEKIHAENVKVFRNIQDTLKEMDLKEEVDLSMEVRYRSLRNRLFWATSLLIVNVGLSIVLLLSVLNII